MADKGEGAATTCKSVSLNALAALNFFLADVQGGVGLFLVIFLTAILHWRPERIGIVMGISGVVGVLAQLPAGALIDQMRKKRLIVAVAAGLIAAGSIGIVLFPMFAVVVVGQSFIGVAGAVFGPAIAAITLGLVGRAALDRQIGRNQSINSTGNVANALMVALVGASLGGNGIFYYVAVLSIATIASVTMIREKDIDYSVARGADARDGARNLSSPGAESEARDKPQSEQPQLSSVVTLLRDRRLMVFAVCCILFHFANAGIGPLVSELLAKSAGMQGGLRLMSASVIMAQLAIIPLGVFIGRRAATSRRKPLYLIPFGLLPLRALMYTCSHQPWFLVAMSVLDGSAMGIFGIMQLLVRADLTKGTGRFNLAQGALSTAVGIGASSSNFVAGFVVRHFGFNAGFLTMAAIAGGALAFFWIFMRETKPRGPSYLAKSSTSQSARKRLAYVP